MPRDPPPQLLNQSLCLLSGATMLMSAGHQLAPEGGPRGHGPPRFTGPQRALHWALPVSSDKERSRLDQVSLRTGGRTGKISGTI